MKVIFFWYNFIEKSILISFTIIDEYCFGESIPTSSKSTFRKLFIPFFLLLTFLKLINIKILIIPLVELTLKILTILLLKSVISPIIGNFFDLIDKRDLSFIALWYSQHTSISGFSIYTIYIFELTVIFT